MHDFLKRLGIEGTLSGAAAGEDLPAAGELLESVSPSDGSVIATVRQATRSEYEALMERSLAAFERWRRVPAPVRGEVVRQIGNALRESKADLGALVSLEMGKIRAEGEGEVQEMIDIADFAVGQSRQLYGKVIASERPYHRMSEQWHPLGPVGIITAFNFPVAVWSWNALIALVCGNTAVWKPSFKTPLTAIAVHKICQRVLSQAGYPDVCSLVIGSNEEIGERLIRDTRVPLISATGSTRMGRHVSQVVAERMGKCLLELGGNNALIVMDDADQDLALRAVLFGSVGTAGQRCTTTRRLLVHDSIADDFTAKLLKAYEQVKIGDPLVEGTLMGPLIDQDAVDQMDQALAAAKAQGGTVLRGGGRVTDGALAKGFFVKPAVVDAGRGLDIVKQETFAPILYVLRFKDLDEAIAMQNAVPQGLSSSIFTESMRNAERFLSMIGSDCGIANVNVGTSGAEIGGAFGGEKETGGGREAGSDAWRAYMRRQTQTINWSDELPLAQGITFG
ncbi:MAG: aldehyde dehydrogenase family protein [Myxococcota bacterium]